MNDWNITEKEALVVALQGIFEDEDDVEQVAGADAGGPGPRLAALERRVRALEEAWRKDRKAS